MRRSWLCFGIAGAAVIGCSLIIDTDPLVSGEGQVATDASVSSDAAPDSKTKDAAASDVVVADVVADVVHDTPPDDGFVELDSPTDVVTGPYCTTLPQAPTLCSDFDEQNLPAGWTVLTQWGSGTGTLDSVESTSAPRSLLLKTPALASSASQSAAYLTRTFAKPTSRIRLEFDLFTQSVFDVPIHLVNIQMAATAGTNIIVLRLGKTAFDVRENTDFPDGGVDYSGHSVTKAPTVSGWNHVVWTIDFTGQNAFSNVDLDGAVSGDELDAKSYLAPAKIDVGIVFARGPSGAWAVRLDNLIVEIT